MPIRLARYEDIDECIKLQRKENYRKNMSPAFKAEYQKMVTNKRIYIYYEEKLLGCIAYKYKKRERVIEIYHFVVSENERGKNIGKKLLSFLYKQLAKYKVPIIVRCRKGAENNKFYLKYGNIKKIEKGNIDVLTIYLNKEKMEDLYARMWNTGNTM